MKGPARAGLSAYQMYRTLGLTDFDFDRFRFRLLRLGQLEIQHTILEFRFHIFLIDEIRQCEAPDKIAIGTLYPMILFPTLFLFLPAFTLDSEDAIFQCDLHIFLLHIGDLRLNLVLPIRFADIHGWYPVGDYHRLLPLSPRQDRKSTRLNSSH